MDETGEVSERRPGPVALRRPNATQDDGTCFHCGKRVYEMEKITADEVAYHKTCFRCCRCNRVLSLANYCALDGQMFCKIHFQEASRTRAGKSGRPADVSIGYDADGNCQQNDSCVDGAASPWRDRSTDGDYDDDRIVRQSQDVKEEIPTVPLRDVRNVFENLSQNASAEKQRMQIQKQPSKWDKPAAATARQRSFDDENRNASVDRDDDQSEADGSDRELVRGTSTVFVVEEELPPPDFTRNIVAKFRELEAGKTAPLPEKKTTRTSWRSSESRSENGHSAGDDEEFAGRWNGEDRGRTERRSELRRRESSSSPQRSAEVEELPQEGTARSLLARWRTIEQQASRNGDDAGGTPRPRSSAGAAKRSQSTSRVELRQRYRATRTSADDGDEDGNSPRVAEYLDVHEKSDDYDDHPPALVTREVLAKFRTLEAESQEAGRQQVPSQRRQDGDFGNEKGFKWEVKEPVPLSRGSLVVHGDVPRRSTSESYQVVEPDFTAGDSSDARDSFHQEDELPPPETTRNLLSMFRSMEDTSRAPPTPETTEKKKAASRSSVLRSQSLGASSYRRDEDDDHFDGPNGDHSDFPPDSVVAENEPVYNADVVRESDRMDEAEIPEEGIIGGLLAKFRSKLQQ